MINRFMKRKGLKEVSNVAPTTPRKIEEIQSDYKEACAALGDRQYRVAVLQAEIQNVTNKLAALNKEADSIPKEVVNEAK